MLLWKRRETRPVDWLLLLGFGTLASMAVRNIILAALVGPFLIASYLPWKKTVPVVAEFAIAALLVVGIGVRVAQGKAFQFRAADWKYPRALPISCWRTTSRARCSIPTSRAAT